MQTTPIAAALAAALAAFGAGSLAGRAMAIFPDRPARAHHVLGPVAVVSETRPPGTAWPEVGAALLGAEARARYGRAVDAVADAAEAPLPNGAGAISTGQAIAYD